jgi:hypothetical protein
MAPCFPTFKPTQIEFETCDRYELMHESPQYDPYSKTFHDKEAGMMNSWVNIKVAGDFHPKRHQVFSLHQKEAEVKFLSTKYTDTSAKLQDISPVLDYGTFLAELDNTTTNLNVSLVKSEIRDKSGVDAALRLKRPKGRARRLPVKMFTDTMYSASPSRQKNKAAHTFCTDFGFVRAFPMKKESEAREALSFLFHCHGWSQCPT